MTRRPRPTSIEQKAIDAWKKIETKSELVDPQSELHWLELCYGFLLGHGIEPKKARALAIKMHYS